MARSLAGILLAGVLLAACGGDDDESASTSAKAPASPKTGPNGELIVQLDEESNSGASGTATLVDGPKASVTIRMKGGDGHYQAHVHNVSCERYSSLDGATAQLATIHEGLSNVAGGSSKSDLRKPLSSYTRDAFSINVHQYEPPYPVVACGDLSPSRDR